MDDLISEDPVILDILRGAISVHVTFDRARASSNRQTVECFFSPWTLQRVTPLVMLLVDKRFLWGHWTATLFMVYFPSALALESLLW